MNSEEKLNIQEEEVRENGEIINEITEDLPLGEQRGGTTEKAYKKFLAENGLDDEAYKGKGRYFPNFDGPYPEWKAERDEEKHELQQEQEQRTQEAQEVSASEPEEFQDPEREWKKAA